MTLISVSGGSTLFTNFIQAWRQWASRDDGIVALDDTDFLVLLSAAQAFHASQDPAMTAQAIVDFIVAALAPRAAFFWRLQEDHQRFDFTAHAPAGSGHVAGQIIARHITQFEMLATQQPEATPPPATEIQRGTWAMPVYMNDAVAGVIVVQFEPDALITDRERRLMALVSFLAGPALDSAAQRAGHNQLQAVFETIPEAMILLDDRGRLLRYNAAAEVLLDDVLAPYVGRSFLSWVRDAGSERLLRRAGLRVDDVREYLHRVQSQSAQPRHRQFTQQHPGDEPRYIDETGSPVFDQHGQRVGWLIVWRDSTEDRQLEHMRQELSSMIVHDLRNPITSITSSLLMMRDLIGEGETSAEVLLDVVNIARSSADYLFNLVQSILDVARLEQNNIVLDCESVALWDCVDYAVMSVLSQAISAQIAVTTHIPGDLPPVWVDDEKIRRVLVNLLDNAVRHTPQGGAVHIASRYDAQAGMVVTYVSDSGPGIPAEARGRIFDKFMQLGKQALRGHKGTGLGLTFCKLAVEAHGGQIWVEDADSGGAAFCFSLPLAPGAADMPNLA